MEKTKADNPLNSIRISPLAAESFGVRSMCTLVETPDLIVLLDAGISLSPYRFNLPPHPIEFQTISRLRKTIAEAANKATRSNHQSLSLRPPHSILRGLGRQLDRRRRNSATNLPKQKRSCQKPERKHQY